MTHLRVGVLGESAGWKRLLDQEGTAYSIVEGHYTAGDFSVVAAPDDIEPELLESLPGYLSAGGGLICSGLLYSQLSRLAARRQYVASLHGEQNAELSVSELVDIEAECHIIEGANALPSSRRCTAFVGEFGGGSVVVLPFDPGLLVLDERSGTKSFYARSRRLPYERVSTVLKDGILRIVSKSLEFLHHRRGLPYVHTWYFPDGAPSLYALRVDSDYAGREGITRLFAWSDSLNLPLTWFVDVRSQEQFIDVFRARAKDEVGVHCYEHTTFAEYQKNVDNIRKAVRVFDSQGMESRSFAAPFGRWNAGLARAVEHCGFEYSSEFEYDHDGMPSFPLLDGKESRTLQVPVHPVSIGSLRRQGFSQQAMREYFLEVASRKLLDRRPVFFYHHPNDGHEYIHAEVLELIRAKGIRQVRMVDYAAWWKTRLNVLTDVEVDGKALHLSADRQSQQVVARIVRADGRESFSPLRARVDLESLTWNPIPLPPPLREDELKTRRSNPWIVLHRIEDFFAAKFTRR